MKYRKALMLQLAREVLMGRISVQEAMQRSRVRDKRTIQAWMERLMRGEKPVQELDLTLEADSCADDISSKSTEEKITKLESELAFSKQRNLEMLHFQKILTNKINDLEVLIQYAEDTYQINILNIKQKKGK